MSYRLYSCLSHSEPSKTRALIDPDALRANWRALCAHIRESGRSPRPIAVVKADAYGHGIPLCVETLLGEGCDFFAVSSISEAIAVRTVCQKVGAKADILILSYTDPTEAPRLAEYDLIQTLLSLEYADALDREAQSVPCCLRVHVAVDTGMNRIGLSAKDTNSVCKTADDIQKLTQREGLRVEGVFSHLARADERKHLESLAKTDQQMSCFQSLVEELRAYGLSNLFFHICNSAGAGLSHSDNYYNGVRLGVALYGVAAVDQLSFWKIPLRPVMRLQSVIAHTHLLYPNEELGYGGTFSASTVRRIATVPIGYADGFLRAYSGATVTVHTKSGDASVPVVGRICMDQCMLDITDTDAEIGDRVTLFGRSSEELAKLAEHAGTIPYEILTSVSARVPRLSAAEKNDE